MGIFDKLMRRGQHKSMMHMMGSGLSGSFRQSDIYKNAVVRETVDAIARHAAKLIAVHMQNGEMLQDNVSYVISERPNPLMSAYDLQYKLISTMLIKNNAFALPVWTRRGELRAVIPVDYNVCEALRDGATGEIWIRFRLTNGNETVLPYSDMIHLRRHYMDYSVLGSPNDTLGDAVEMINLGMAGMMSAVKNGSNMRGIIKIKNAMLKDSDVKKNRDQFIHDYLETSDTGVAAMDASMDYIQLDPTKMYSLSTEQMIEIRSNVHRQYGVCEKFIRGEYDEAIWNATYEAVIEPIDIQLTMEYSNALISPKDKINGHRIEFQANRMQYASLSTKTEVAKNLGMLGLITYDEGRAIFTLPPLPEGQGKRLIPPWNGGTEEGSENP